MFVEQIELSQQENKENSKANQNTSSSIKKPDFSEMDDSTGTGFDQKG